MIVRVRAFVVVAELMSVTCTTMLLVPVVVGVPEMAPAPGNKDSPPGRVPESISQISGELPPDAVNVAL